MRIRFASLRRKKKSVRFAFASHFKGPISQKSENFRRNLAIILPENDQFLAIFSRKVYEKSIKKSIFSDFKFSYWENNNESIIYCRKLGSKSELKMASRVLSTRKHFRNSTTTVVEI